MPTQHKFDARPWWDTGAYPMHRDDGTRYCHRIDYARLPIHPEFTEGFGLNALWSSDSGQRLNARRKLWRRLRTSFYERNDPKAGFSIQAATDEVPRCGARCRDGHACRARAVKNPVTGKQTRCRMHGGKSPGPKTQDGRARSLAALARGRQARWRKSCAKRQ